MVKVVELIYSTKLWLFFTAYKLDDNVIYFSSHSRIPLRVKGYYHDRILRQQMQIRTVLGEPGCVGTQLVHHNIYILKSTFTQQMITITM